MMDWREELILKYPKLFHPPAGRLEAADGYPECHVGWRDILEEACAKIDHALRARGEFKVDQIKEKMGTLRFYWSSPLDLTDETETIIDNAVREAELKSAKTCEICGAEGWLHKKGGVLMTRCGEHAEGPPL